MLISRNPFAREELHKHVSYRRTHTGPTCRWCGNRDARGRLWAFEIQTDGGSTHRIPGDFCCAACMRTYHNH